jgi:hypothetical protein
MNYGYLFIHHTIPADKSFTFYLMNNWINDYFSLPHENNIDINHNSVKVDLFNSDGGIMASHYLNLIYLMLIDTRIEVVLLMALCVK